MNYLRNSGPGYGLGFGEVGGGVGGGGSFQEFPIFLLRVEHRACVDKLFQAFKHFGQFGGGPFMGTTSTAGMK